MLTTQGQMIKLILSWGKNLKDTTPFTIRFLDYYPLLFKRPRKTTETTTTESVHYYDIIINRSSPQSTTDVFRGLLMESVVCWTTGKGVKNAPEININYKKTKS